MTQLLYIPGFQEEKIGRAPGPQISKYCDDNKIDFYTIDVPGNTDTSPETETKFSMTALKVAIKEKIVNILDNSEEDLTIVAYSLSARPTIDVINELSDEYKERIKLKLIHPAYNPLYTVKVMDWIRSEGMSQIMTDDYYLGGEDTTIFKTLIDSWKGNHEQFKKDLQDYVNEGVFTYEEFQKYITTLGYSIEIVGDEISKDRVIHNLDNIEYTKENRGKLKVAGTHAKKFRNEMSQIGG